MGHDTATLLSGPFTPRSGHGACFGEAGAVRRIVSPGPCTPGAFLELRTAFQLTVNVVRTWMAPSFRQIRQLAAVAAIRTALNYLLARDRGGTSATAGRRKGHRRWCPQAGRPPSLTGRTPGLDDRARLTSVPLAVLLDDAKLPVIALALGAGGLLLAGTGTAARAGHVPGDAHLARVCSGSPPGRLSAERLATPRCARRTTIRRRRRRSKRPVGCTRIGSTPVDPP